MVAESAGEKFGVELVYRLAQQERFAAQSIVLQALAQSTFCADIVLWGSAALQYGYLANNPYRRTVKDFDLMAPPEIAAQFTDDLPSLSKDLGIPLTYRATENGVIMPAYIIRGSVFPEVVVTLDVKTRTIDNYLNQLAIKTTDIHTTTGTVFLPTVNLCHLLAVKVDCLSHRGNANDFVDVWLGLTQYPDIFPQLQQSLQEKETHAVYLADDVMERLQTLENDWQKALVPTMRRVPDYSVVRRDLEFWLSKLGGSPIF